MRLSGMCVAALLCTVVTSSAVAARTDAALKKSLIGTWTIDTGNVGNDFEREAMNLRIYATIRYNDDGTGTTELRVDQWCGRLLRRHAFKWDIQGGMLVTTDEKGTSKDKIVELTDQRASFIAMPDGLHENRLKVSGPDCTPH